YPSSTFIGIDINYFYFPLNDKCPPNVGFLTSNSQWFELIKDIVRVLKYDDWIKSLEATAQFINYGKVTKWIDEAVYKACMKKKGVNVRISALIPKMFESNEELTNIQCVKIKYPIGEWFGCF
ncbi:10709_t:CDS:2, partial [Racocetra persica]